MSTMRVTTLKNESSATDQIVLNADGSIGGTLGSELAAKWTTQNAWTTWTPAVSGTGWALGNGASGGRYIQIGKTVHFTGSLSFGSTSTFGSGGLTVSLPVTAYAGVRNARIEMFDTSGNDRRLGATFPSGVSGLIIHSLGTNGVMVVTSSTSPWTWANGDTVYFDGTYEAD